MRNKKVRELNPYRHRAIKILREKNELHTCIDINGNTILLNLRKHFLLGVPYKNAEYQMELERNRGKLIKEGNRREEGDGRNTQEG